MVAVLMGNLELAKPLIQAGADVTARDAAGLTPLKIARTSGNDEMIRLLKLQVDAAIKTDRLKPNDAMKILANYEKGLKGYTYLNFNGAKPPQPNGAT